MKKAKLLIAVLVCAVMMMGVGYAWWNNSVTLTGTIATGVMDVDFTNASLTKSAYVTGEAIISTTYDKTVSFTVGNLYPGATAIINSTVQNDSTIPVKLKKAVVKYSEWNTSINDWTEISKPSYLTVTLPTINGNVAANGGSVPYNIQVVVGNNYGEQIENKQIKVDVTADWTQFNYSAI